MDGTTNYWLIVDPPDWVLLRDVFLDLRRFPKAPGTQGWMSNFKIELLRMLKRAGMITISSVHAAWCTADGGYAVGGCVVSLAENVPSWLAAVEALRVLLSPQMRAGG